MSEQTGAQTPSLEVSPEQDQNKNDAKIAKSITKAERRISELEQRVVRMEKRTRSNEQFARTLATCLSTQIIGVDAVTEIVRRAIATDTDTHKELNIAIREYDKRKLRRWCSGFLGVILWIGSITAAAVIGALIHWVFAGA